MAVGENQQSVSLQERLATDCGVHELEYCYDASTLWNNQLYCRKNPGHFNFIPVAEFGAGHLPVACRDKRVVSYIKRISRFTVRLVVKHTSADRPVYYPCANVRRTGLIRLASGSAWVPTESSELPCPIPDCSYSKDRHNVYGYIRVLTNKHVVYNSEEALNTKAQFFYDSQNHYDRSVVAQCVALEYSLEDNDVAHLKCVTHDPYLFHVLREEFLEITALYNRIPPHVWQACSGVCIVIGHPHGMPKVISVGEHLHFQTTLTSSHAHYHTGPTCPGSSGAPVYYVCQKEKGNNYMWVPAIHSFHCLAKKMNCAFR